MAFGWLTTKWRIFRLDLLSENGTQKNCQIIRCSAKLHNYVINADNLNFLNVDNDDFETLEVEPLEEGPDGNRGFLPVPFYAFEKLNMIGTEVDNHERRKCIVDQIRERGLTRPSYNIERNK